MPSLGSDGGDNGPQMNERNVTEVPELEIQLAADLVRLAELDSVLAPQLAGAITTALAAALDELDES
ncbi:hypothetical protein BH18ACT5_BH18ACT5_17050 [soil metagenome]